MADNAHDAEHDDDDDGDAFESSARLGGLMTSKLDLLTPSVSSWE